MKDFFEKLNALGNPKRVDIIEKDYHLHRLLNQISQDDYLSENLIFKGGTCLVKAYLDYYRFSEDIDFTWQNEQIWRGKSKTETTKLCSKEISELLRHFKPISETLGLQFKGDKSDTTEVHISSGGRMVLFFIGYNSEILNIKSRLKLEINFVDIMKYKPINKQLKSYIEGIESEEMEFLYEDLWKEYTTPIKFNCYDPKEIFIEMCRSSLTRKAYKLRDIIDIYFLETKFGYSILEYRKEIKEKVRFMLDLYNRYQENLELVQFPTADVLQSEELKLMLTAPPPDLKQNIGRIHKQLDEVRIELVAY